MEQNNRSRFIIIKAMVKSYHPLLFIPSTLILLCGFVALTNVVHEYIPAILHPKYDMSIIENVPALFISLIIAFACIFMIGGIYSRCLAVLLRRYTLSIHTINKKEQYDTEEWDNQAGYWSTVTHMNISTDIGSIQVNYEPVFKRLIEGKSVYCLQTKTISPIKYIVIPEEWLH